MNEHRKQGQRLCALDQGNHHQMQRCYGMQFDYCISLTSILISTQWFPNVSDRQMAIYSRKNSLNLIFLLVISSPSLLCDKHSMMQFIRKFSLMLPGCLKKSEALLRALFQNLFLIFQTGIWIDYEEYGRFYQHTEQDVFEIKHKTCKAYSRDLTAIVGRATPRCYVKSWICLGKTLPLTMVRDSLNTNWTSKVLDHFFHKILIIYGILRKDLWLHWGIV